MQPRSATNIKHTFLFVWPKSIFVRFAVRSNKIQRDGMRKNNENLEIKILTRHKFNPSRTSFFPLPSFLVFIYFFCCASTATTSGYFILLISRLNINNNKTFSCVIKLKSSSFNFLDLFSLRSAYPTRSRSLFVKETPSYL